LLLKSLEFKHRSGQKVKVIEIPVLEEDSPYRFMIGLRLQSFITNIDSDPHPKKVYSFREYLKKVLKWRDYQLLFKTNILKNNA
jgi:hypothetical protein